MFEKTFNTHTDEVCSLSIVSIQEWCSLMPGGPKGSSDVDKNIRKFYVGLVNVLDSRGSPDNMGVPGTSGIFKMRMRDS